jgi:hypothetical protein
MKHRCIAGAVAALALVSAAPSTSLGADSSVNAAHRSGCHGAHSCPSDHATYRWRGWLCISHASGDYRRGYNHKIAYGGRTYFCKK